MTTTTRTMIMEERTAPASSGMGILVLFTLLYLAALGGCIWGGVTEAHLAITISCAVWLFIGWIPFCGLRVLRPNEAYVLTLFGQYYGTLRGPGFFFVNPFVTAINPAANTSPSTGETVGAEEVSVLGIKITEGKASLSSTPKRMSLKTMTLNNDKQKINDKLGNPIVIGIVVVWQIKNTARAAFNVDNYAEFLSIQCDSALRNIVRLYPYDTTDDNEMGEKSLRGSSMEIAQNLRDEIQSKVEIAGLEIQEARITNLAYAPEIAAAMLQRQQASAIIDARQMIVEGAVGMVETALSKLSENQIVDLDEERKATMVSNLLVVLCGNKDAQPVVNSGSLY